MVTEYRRAFAAFPVSVIDASLSGPREAWDEVLSRPGGGRLTIVHEASRLMPSPVLPVVLEESSLVYPVVFTTPDPAFTRTDGDHLGQLVDSRKAQVIRCVPPSREEDCAALVASWWPGLSVVQASQVLERCGGSLLLAREACEKGVRAALSPALSAEVCRKEHGTGFSDLIIAGNRKEAATVACEVPAPELLGTLRLLGSRLSVLALLHLAVRDGLSPREQSAKLKADPYVLRLLRPHAGDYPPSRAVKCREVLAVAEQAVAGGAAEGVLEAVALLW